MMCVKAWVVDIVSVDNVSVDVVPVCDERDNCRNEGSLVIIKSHTHGERKPVVRSAAMIIAGKSRVLYRISIESEHHLGHLQPRGSLFFFIPNLGP